MTKPCSKCGKPKDADYRSHRCPDCNREYLKAWRAVNPDKRKEQRRSHRSRHSETENLRAARWAEENSKRKQEVNRQWAERNADKIADFLRTWYSENRELACRLSREWKAKNPEKKKDHRHRRRARLKGCVISPVDVRAVLEASGGLCALCHAFVPQEFRHIDHIIPLDKGGPHVQENLQLTCYRCNTSKGAKLPEEVTPEVWVKKPRPGQPFLLNPNWK